MVFGEACQPLPNLNLRFGFVPVVVIGLIEYETSRVECHPTGHKAGAGIVEKLAVLLNSVIHSAPKTRIFSWLHAKTQVCIVFGDGKPECQQRKPGNHRRFLRIEFNPGGRHET